MPALRKYNVSVSLEVEITTSEPSVVMEEALTKATSILGRRNTSEGRDEYTRALESINIYKEN